MWWIVHVTTTVVFPPGPCAVTVVYCVEPPEQLSGTGYEPDGGSGLGLYGEANASPTWPTATATCVALLDVHVGDACVFTALPMQCTVVSLFGPLADSVGLAGGAVVGGAVTGGTVGWLPPPPGFGAGLVVDAPPPPPPPPPPGTGDVVLAELDARVDEVEDPSESVDVDEASGVVVDASANASSAVPTVVPSVRSPIEPVEPGADPLGAGGLPPACTAGSLDPPHPAAASAHNSPTTAARRPKAGIGSAGEPGNRDNG